MQHHRRIALALLALASVAATHFLPRPGETVPVLLGGNGSSEPTSPDGTCTDADLSASARIVAFTSEATNLVAGDTDTVRDIVVANLRKGTGTLASVSTEGVKGDAESDDPVLDRRGKRVVFSSEASNLVADDLNGMKDIFVRDLKKHTTVRVSVASDGTEANGRSVQAALSGNGQVVVFASIADNLVPGDTNGLTDVFAHDLRTGETLCLSVTPDGLPADGISSAPAVSASGRYVAFLSEASNLGPAVEPGTSQAFVRDLVKGTTQLASVGLEGALADGDCHDLSISANGRRVAFVSAASNLVAGDAHPGLDVFVLDRKKQVTRLVTRGLEGAAADADSREANISRNGKWLAFTSDATNLVVGDQNACTDVFRWSLKKGLIDRVSVASSGEEADGNSDNGCLQRNGRFVSFSTRASNLFEGAADGAWSVAIRRP